MPLSTYHRQTDGVLWSVRFQEHHEFARGQRYFWDNRDREPGQRVFQLVTRGWIHFWEAGREHILRPGDLVLFAHGEDSVYGHHGPLPERYGCRWFTFEGAGLDEHTELFRRQHGSLHHIGLKSPAAETLARLNVMAAPGSGTPPTTLAHTVHSFITQLYEHAERRVLEQLTPAERAVEELHRDPCRPWSLKSLAAEVGCTREHLTRVFHKRTQTSPAAFLNKARTHRAIALLTETDMPVKVVAAQAGFSNPHAMARHVKAATGKAPSMLR